MKKIISLIVMVACILGLVACGGGGSDIDPAKDPIAAINRMYSVSCPTKIEGTAERKIGDRVYESTEMIIVGKVDGKDAAVYESSYEELASIEEGAETPIVTRVTRVEYLEGKGTRTNGGNWDAEGKSFAPTNGSIAINITSETVSNAAFSEDGKTFTCTVKAANTAAVFGEGEGIASDVSVTITTNGTQVTAVEMSWQVAATEETPAVEVTVRTVYSYDLEVISLQK